jgi:hypothetical protein
MTLEEAIRHAEEKAKCGGECGEDHAQLAEWLKELRERRAAQPEKRTEERTETHACDCISRAAAVDHFRLIIDATNTNNRYKTGFVDGLEVCISHLSTMPSAQPERLTDDDFETIRIHLNAYKEKLCNQQRWEEADEYQRIIDRFMAFASAQQEIIRCKDCKHHHRDNSGAYYCGRKDYGYGWGLNDFCSDAERRTDE